MKVRKLKEIQRQLIDKEVSIIRGSLDNNVDLTDNDREKIALYKDQIKHIQDAIDEAEVDIGFDLDIIEEK